MRLFRISNTVFCLEQGIYIYTIYVYYIVVDSPDNYTIVLFSRYIIVYI